MPTRPRNLLDNFGLDVEIKNESLGNNPVLAEMLKDMGKTVKPQGHEYIGSFCTHMYKSVLGREIAYIHQHHFSEIPSESIVSMAASDLAVHLMKKIFGRNKPATRDKRDKRKDLT